MILLHVHNPTAVLVGIFVRVKFREKCRVLVASVVHLLKSIWLLLETLPHTHTSALVHYPVSYIPPLQVMVHHRQSEYLHDQIIGYCG